MNYTINIKGRLLDLSRPVVMGILNATPNSFYDGSRKQTEREIVERANQIVGEGGAIIDAGAYSTRPGAEQVTEEEEMRRLRLALEIIRREQPMAALSIDTFRPSVARMAVEEFGADIINDVSEGQHPDMFATAASLGTPYILTSTKSNMPDMLMAFAREVQELRDLGQKDIILDPGFGFGKTLEENYEIMHHLDKLRMMELPVLAGVSRKSMIYKLTGGDPGSSLNGTTALNTMALMKGAAILRVHDVREAVETIRIYEAAEHAETRKEKTHRQ